MINDHYTSNTFSLGGGGIGQCSAIECEELSIGINLTDYSAW